MTTLRELDRFFDSPAVQTFREIERSIPRADSAEGQTLARLARVVRAGHDIYLARRAWAERRAGEEEEQLAGRKQRAEDWLEDRAADVRDLYGRLGFDMTKASPTELLDGWPQVSDLVERHLQDKRNLDRPARPAPDGSVVVDETADPVVDTARTLRDALTSLGEIHAQAEVLRQRMTAGVDPFDVDEKHVAILNRLLQSHPGAVRVTTDHDPMPELDPAVEAELRRHGLGSTD
jgi:hypothetical protein